MGIHLKEMAAGGEHGNRKCNIEVVEDILKSKPMHSEPYAVCRVCATDLKSKARQ